MGTVKDDTLALCGALTDAGCVYDCEFDNRGGNRSNYVFVRKPVPAKIRISDHKSDRIEKDKARARMLVIDVGRYGVSWLDAVAQVTCPQPQDAMRK